MITAQALIAKFEQALREEWGYIWGTAGILWDESRQKQKVQYMVSKYGSGWKTGTAAKQDNYYYAALYGSKWAGHRVADCSGLFRWAFGELGGKIAHGSNSIWKSYCSARGTLSRGRRADGKALLPGAAVFTDKAGDKTHIGLYIGNGQVIEASGTQAGVVTSKVTASKWKCWGELKDVLYERQEGEPDIPSPSTAPPAEPSPAPRLLRRGCRGDDVAQCQRQLMALGYDLGKSGADGIFGPKTDAAVRAYQLDRGLSADGIIGPLTRAALKADG